MKKAMIVDSDAVAREFVKDTLLDIGFDCDEYDSAETATTAPVTYDVYIVEAILPGVDGVQLCSQLREITDAPIIVLSALDNIAWKAASFFCGADNYLCKPIDPCELKLHVLSAIRRSDTK